MIEKNVWARCIGRFGNGRYIVIDTDGNGGRATLFLDVFNRYGFSKEEQAPDMAILVNIKQYKDRRVVVEIHNFNGKPAGPNRPIESKQKPKKRSRCRRKSFIQRSMLS